MPRVTLVTCVWLRRELTRAFWVWAQWLQHRWRVTHGIELSLVAAASGPNDTALAEEYGVYVVQHANEPLGAKFNAALLASRDTTPDWVLIMGSDDFFCEKVADAIGDAVLAQRSVGFQDCYFADLLNGPVRYIAGYRQRSRHDEPVGPGAIHSRDVLERLHWRLFDPHKHHGTDVERFNTLRANGYMPELLNCQALGGTLLDVKTDVNLWPFDRTRKQPLLSPEEGQAVWNRLPAEVLDAIPWPVPVLP